MRHLFISNDPAAHGGMTPFGNLARTAALLANAGHEVHMIVPDLTKSASLPSGVTIRKVAWADRHVTDRSVPARQLASPEAIGAFCGPVPALAWSCLAEKEMLRALGEDPFDFIHAPDFEAPLYTFQLMRATGLGPTTCPPIIIHLLQQSEDRVIANDEDVYAPANVQLWRAERFTCAVADAWTCPSEWFTRDLEDRHGLPSGAIRVIPPGLSAPPSISATGFCFEGDIEPASGLFELGNALKAAPDTPLRCDLTIVGDDQPYAPLNSRRTSEQFLRLLPASLKPKVRVNPQEAHAFNATFLALARHALAPSQEALSFLESGHGVLAASTAGFDSLNVPSVRIVAPTAVSLATALREEATVAPAWDNREEVLTRWNTIFAEVAQAGANRSMRLPGFLPFGGRHKGRSARRRAAADANTGIAVVIPHFNLSSVLHEAVATALEQTPRPADVLVVDDGSTEPAATEALAHAEKAGARVLRKRNAGLSAARNSGFHDVLAHLGNPPAGFIFLDADDRLRPGCIEACQRVLTTGPEVGIVSFWTHHFESVDWYWTNVCPAFPFQIHTNEVATFSAYRTEAILEAGGYREEMFLGYEDWDFTNAIMARGWAAVGIPRILADYRVRADSMLRGMGAHAHGLMVRRMHERTPEVLALDPVEITMLGEGVQFQLRGELVVLRGMVARWRRMAHRPDLAAKWAFDKISTRLGRKKK